MYGICLLVLILIQMNNKTRASLYAKKNIQHT